MVLIKKITYLILLFCYSSQAQQKAGIDFEHIFKNWIYIEKTSDLVKDKYNINPFTIKNDSVYAIFSKNIKLKISDVKSNLPPNYEVKSLLLNESNVINTDSNLTPYNIGINSFAYNPQCDGELILIFNKNTGMSYRVKGFNGNDCLIFLTDLKISIFKKSGKEFKRNRLLKDYKIEGVDLECIYRVLIDEKSNYHKLFPCLKSCLDPIIIE